MADRRLHWSPRRFHRNGLYHFLVLAYALRWEDPEAPAWYRIWQRNRFASVYALRHFHRRLPRHLGDPDRWRVAYLLQRPDADVAIIKPRDVQRARRWTLR